MEVSMRHYSFARSIPGGSPLKIRMKAKNLCWNFSFKMKTESTVCFFVNKILTSNAFHRRTVFKGTGKLTAPIIFFQDGNLLNFKVGSSNCHCLAGVSKNFSTFPNMR
jgi:hypothetical protein